MANQSLQCLQSLALPQAGNGTQLTDGRLFIDPRQHESVFAIESYTGRVDVEVTPWTVFPCP